MWLKLLRADKAKASVKIKSFGQNYRKTWRRKHQQLIFLLSGSVVGILLKLTAL